MTKEYGYGKTSYLQLQKRITIPVRETKESNQYDKNGNHRVNFKKKNTTLTTERYDNLQIKGRRTHERFGTIKAVPHIGRNLLPIVQLTKDSKLKVQLK